MLRHGVSTIQLKLHPRGCREPRWLWEGSPHPPAPGGQLLHPGGWHRPCCHRSPQSSSALQATPGAAGAASNKLQQDEFMIFWMGRPRRKEGWTSGRLVPGGGLRPLQRELRLPSPFPNRSPSGVKQSHTGQVLRNTTHYSVSHGSSLLSRMQSQHRESAGRRIRGMESYNWQRATHKISLARAGLSSFSPAEGLQRSTPTSRLALVFV